MKKIKYLLVALFLVNTTMYAQLKVDAELRPRAEYRHGFKTLFTDNPKAALFTS